MLIFPLQYYCPSGTIVLNILENDVIYLSLFIAYAILVPARGSVSSKHHESDGTCTIKFVWFALTDQRLRNFPERWICGSSETLYTHRNGASSDGTKPVQGTTHGVAGDYKMDGDAPCYAWTSGRKKAVNYFGHVSFYWCFTFLQSLLLPVSGRSPTPALRVVSSSVVSQLLAPVFNSTTFLFEHFIKLTASVGKTSLYVAGLKLEWKASFRFPFSFSFLNPVWIRHNYFVCCKSPSLFPRGSFQQLSNTVHHARTASMSE